jgi:hypothetical protein
VREKRNRFDVKDRGDTHGEVVESMDVIWALSWLGLRRRENVSVWDLRLIDLAIWTDDATDDSLDLYNKLEFIFIMFVLKWNFTLSCLIWMLSTMLHFLKLWRWISLGFVSYGRD